MTPVIFNFNIADILCLSVCVCVYVRAHVSRVSTYVFVTPEISSISCSSFMPTLSICGSKIEQTYECIGGLY